ncbi:MAG: hypothetical protein WBF08_00505 [Candidatus Bathyarchaeia archaeon]
MRIFKLLLLTILIVVFSTMIFPARCAFTVPPTLDLTASSSCSGATDVVYAFHSENPNGDLLGTVVAFSVIIPDGYLINPAYLTSTPDIVVMTGSYGDMGGPIKGYLKLLTTTIPGQFDLYANDVPTPDVWNLAGNVIITIPGNILGFPNVYLNIGEFVDLSFIAGFFINPTTPGVYTWTATATAPDADVTSFVPRSGFTNQVLIEVCAVGGYIAPINKITILAPYLALAAILGIMTTIVIVKRRPKASYNLAG